MIKKNPHSQKLPHPTSSSSTSTCSTSPNDLPNFSPHSLFIPTSSILWSWTQMTALSNFIEHGCVKPSKWLITKRWLSKSHDRPSITCTQLAWVAKEIVITSIPTFVNVASVLNFHTFAIVAYTMFFPMDLSNHILPMRHLSPFMLNIMGCTTLQCYFPILLFTEF